MSFNTQKYGAMTKEHRRKKGIKMNKKVLEKEVVFENEKYVFFIRVKDNDRFEMVKEESEDIYFLIENLEFFRVDYLFGKE